MPTCYKTQRYPYIRYDGHNEKEVLELIHGCEYRCYIGNKDEKLQLQLYCPFLIVNPGYYVVANLPKRGGWEGYTAEVVTPEAFATNFETRES